jgi:hypothetical protein
MERIVAKKILRELMLDVLEAFDSSGGTWVI